MESLGFIDLLYARLAFPLLCSDLEDTIDVDVLICLSRAKLGFKSP